MGGGEYERDIALVLLYLLLWAQILFYVNVRFLTHSTYFLHRTHYGFEHPIEKPMDNKEFIAFCSLARIIVSHFFRTTSNKAVISNAQSKLEENVEKFVLINHCSMETQLHSSSNSRLIKPRQDSFVIITENVDFQL